MDAMRCVYLACAFRKCAFDRLTRTRDEGYRPAIIEVRSLRHLLVCEPSLCRATADDLLGHLLRRAT